MLRSTFMVSLNLEGSFGCLNSLYSNLIRAGHIEWSVASTVKLDWKFLRLTTPDTRDLTTSRGLRLGVRQRQGEIESVKEIEEKERRDTEGGERERERR